MYCSLSIRLPVLAAALALPALVACSEMRVSEPGRTAAEQLLFSSAVDRVCDSLAIQLPENAKVFVDSSYVEGTDSKYLVASLRDRILRHGGRLVDARGDADVVFEPRIGALSVDRKKTLVGIPSIPIPIPLAGELNIPELALFKRDRQQGVVKLALISYDAETGALRSSQGPLYGFSQRTDWVALLFVGWEDNDLMPEPQNDDWVGESTFDGILPDYEAGP
ncbi:DUF6655 family protein [Pelagibius marinus]|uniref:DUF6655 family protein n=1 Tax=Pelagibius marinus TaxID=2762760 RepID=UPI0018726ECC|nr:DUF6655 family protein [Pelagibius marinus]